MLIDSGVVSVERAASWVERLEGVGGGTKQVEDYVREIRQERRLPPLFALARGQRHGKPATVAATLRAAPPVGMGGATGVPLAIAFKLLHPSLGVRPGVYPPEACLDPTAFFDELAAFCRPRCTGAEGLVLVTRSWEAGDLVSALHAARSQEEEPAA